MCTARERNLACSLLLRYHRVSVGVVSVLNLISVVHNIYSAYNVCLTYPQLHAIVIPL